MEYLAIECIEQSDNLRSLSDIEAENPLMEILVKFRIDPWHILSRFSESACHTRQTIIKWNVKKEYRITLLKSSRHGAEIIAVNNPLIGL